MKYVLFFFLGVALVSCDSLSPSERLLVGKWYAVSELSESDMEALQELNEVFNEDKTCEVNGLIRYKVKGDDEGDLYTIITLNCKLKGTWKIENKMFTEKYSYVDISVQDIDFEGRSVTTNLVQLNAAKETTKKSVYYDIVIPLKKAYFNDVGTVKVKKLNNDFFEVQNSDNAITTYKRIVE